jgi:hypothetical protein
MGNGGYHGHLPSKTQNFWDWVVGVATQGDEGMGTRENIIECMYVCTREPLVILFHVCLMMFWTPNMVLFLAFDMELALL